MNSESWRDPLQELWQRQPVPPAAVRAEERILRAVQDAEERERRETGDYADISWWLLPLLYLPSLADAYFRDEFWWGEWLIQVSLWGFMLGMVLSQRRRRQFDRDFGATLLDRIEHGAALLRLRLKGNHVNLIGGPLFASAGTLFVYQGTNGSMRAAVLTCVVSLPALSWWFTAYWRKRQTHLQQRIAALETLRAELTGGGP